jgi:HEPN domain-containing protein
VKRKYATFNNIIGIQFEEDIIIALDSLYIESRYPGEFGLLPEGKPNQKQAKAFYDFAQNIFEAVKLHLEKG